MMEKIDVLHRTIKSAKMAVGFVRRSEFGFVRLAGLGFSGSHWLCQ
jgi:hypothetical protein